MGEKVRIVGIKRKAIDEDKLALAFLMLAKIIHEQSGSSNDGSASETSGEAEAA
jgi:hypothetical protein